MSTNVDFQLQGVYCCFNRATKDGTPVPKHVGVNIHYEMYFTECIFWLV